MTNCSQFDHIVELLNALRIEHLYQFFFGEKPFMTIKFVPFIIKKYLNGDDLNFVFLAKWLSFSCPDIVKDNVYLFAVFLFYRFHYDLHLPTWDAAY